MAEENQTRAQTSIAVLKNANKHMSELLTTNETMNQIMGAVASDLNHLSRQVGELHVTAWIDGGWQTTSFRSHINSLVSKLENGRK